MTGKLFLSYSTDKPPFPLLQGTYYGLFQGQPLISKTFVYLGLGD